MSLRTVRRRASGFYSMLIWEPARAQAIDSRLPKGKLLDGARLQKLLAKLNNPNW